MPSSARRAARSSRQRIPTEPTTKGASGKTAGSRSSKTRKSKSSTTRSLEQQALLLVAATEPLLAFFAELDDVFTEDEALSPEFRKISLGRCYEAWQRCRKAFDPDFVAADYRRPRRTDGPLARASRARNTD